MKKLFPHISTFVLTLALVFAVSGLVFPQIQTAHAQVPPGGPSVSPPVDSSKCGVTNPWQCFLDLLLIVPGYAAIGLLKLASLLTYLSGALLNFVVRYSIVDMTNFVSESGVINGAWSKIRDIANMGFIFILLYAAIETILGIGSDTKKLIVNIIVVAILINFSLFFTKIVIDMSNILAIFFYDIIAPGALSATATTGLSNQLMQPLDLQSIFNTKLSGLEGGRLFTIGVMGTILALIVAFVFFAISIMFVIRIVVLIFVLILSPIAFIATVLPALKTYADKWKDALLGQAFFAPIYFMLTYIVVVVSKGLLKGGGDLSVALNGQIGPDGVLRAPDATNMGILVNFIIVIVLLITSLVIAKEWANKVGPGVAGLTKWAMGAAGGATLGMAGRFGRGTVGRAGTAIGESEMLKERAAKGGVLGMASRLALATGRKTSGASFDIRGTALGGTLEAGKASGKGGYAEFKKKRAEAAEKRARGLAPTDEVLDQAEQDVERKRAAKAPIIEIEAAQARLDRLKGISKKEAEQRRADAKKEMESNPLIRREEEVRANVRRAQEDVTAAIDPALKALREKELEKQKQELESAKAATADIRAALETSYREIAELQKGAAGRRKEAYAKVMEKSLLGRALGYNKAAAAQIRKGKSTKERFTEIAATLAKETTEAEGGETQPAAASTQPSTPPTPPI